MLLFPSPVSNYAIYVQRNIHSGNTHMELNRLPPSGRARQVAESAAAAGSTVAAGRHQDVRAAVKRQQSVCST